MIKISLDFVQHFKAETIIIMKNTVCNKPAIMS